MCPTIHAKFTTSNILAKCVNEIDAAYPTAFLRWTRVSSVPHHAHPLSDQNRCYNGGSK
jgi:hypothetical protein